MMGLDNTHNNCTVLLFWHSNTLHLLCTGVKDDARYTGWDVSCVSLQCVLRLPCEVMAGLTSVEGTAEPCGALGEFIPYQVSPESPSAALGTGFEQL